MRKTSRIRKTLLIATVTAVVLGGLGYWNRGALAALGYEWFLADRVEKKLAQSYEPLPGRSSADPSSAPKQETMKDPFSLLLMGVDARNHERGRSDTLIYTVVRPKDGYVLMVSIPRDTYAELVGRNRSDKITHAYVYGGPEMTVNSVEELLDVKVDHYASINFQGFVKTVDTLGGIPLPITKDIVNKQADHEKFTVKANKSSYSGVEALNYVRYREDAGGDMSRTERNRVFLESLAHRAASLGQWSKIPEVLGIVGENFRTDLPPQSLTDLIKAFLQTDHHIVSYTLKGEGKRMGSSHLWYYVTNEDDLATVQKTIAAWLDPDATTSELHGPGAQSENPQPSSSARPQPGQSL